MVRRSMAGGRELREDEEHGDLEGLADAELSAHGFMLGKVKLFTEKRLLRKITREENRAPDVSDDDLPNEVLEYLIERRVSQVIRGAGLTRLQRTVYGLYLRGLTVTQITDKIGLSRQRVSIAVLMARDKVRKTRDPHEGLQEVYWSEVRRPIYRKPRHRR
jgi:hypothetical protein